MSENEGDDDFADGYEGDFYIEGDDTGKKEERDEKQVQIKEEDLEDKVEKI